MVYVVNVAKYTIYGWYGNGFWFASCVILCQRVVLLQVWLLFQANSAASFVVFAFPQLPSGNLT